MISFFIRLFLNLVWKPLMSWLNPEHDLPCSGAQREKPDPDLYPNFMQNKKGIWLHWRFWPQTNGAAKPKGVIYMLHGLAEHHARYEGTAAYFNAQGYACYMMENQGHGSSEGIRKYWPEFSEIVEDHVQFVNTILRPAVKSQHNDVPIFCFGHSLGGLISVHLSHRMGKSVFRAVLLSGAALKVDEKIAPPLLVAIGGFVGSIFPKLPVSMLDGTKVARNRQVVNFYMQDPLVPGGPLKAKFGDTCIKAQQQVNKIAASFDLPILIMHGTHDALTLPEGSKEFYENIQSKDKQLNLYDQYYHELLNENKLDRIKVRMDMLNFMDQRL